MVARRFQFATCYPALPFLLRRGSGGQVGPSGSRMEHHCFSRLGKPCSSSHSLFMAQRTKLIWLIRQWPFRARLALWTSPFAIPSFRSLRRRVRGCGTKLPRSSPGACLPVVKPHASTHPLIKGANLAKRNPNREVVDRSTKVALKVDDDFRRRVTSRPLRQSSYFTPCEAQPFTRSALSFF